MLRAKHSTHTKLSRSSEKSFRMTSLSKAIGLSKIAFSIFLNLIPSKRSVKQGQPLKIAFLVPLYHTNMLAMIESLTSANHQVIVIVARTENVENYSFLTPITIKQIENDPDIINALPFNVPDLILVREYAPSMIKIAEKLLGPETKIYNYNQKPLRRNKGLKFLIKDLKRLRTHQIKGIPLRGFSPVDHHLSIKSRWPKKLLTQDFNFPVFQYETTPVQTTRHQERIQILMVGKLAQPRKRHFWLIDALKSSGVACDLHICGSGLDMEFDDGTRDKDYYYELKKCAEESAKSSNLVITLFEDVNFFELSEFYSKAEIFVLPSIQEEFGISVLEAMAHSCAVIVSDECGSARHITDGVDGLVFPSADYIAFEKKVHRLLQDSALRIAIQNQAKRTITTNHNYSQFAEFIESLANE